MTHPNVEGSTKSINKKRIYWFVVIVIVLILPIGLYVGYKHFQKKKPLYKTVSADVDIPLISEQPTDTIVANKTLAIHSWNTKEGIKVIFVPTEDLPLIDIDVSFNAGSARDGQKHGLARFAGAILDQGTKDMPNKPDIIASMFENSGSIFRTIIGRDRTRILLRSLINSRDFNKVLDLYINVIVNPSFDLVAVERERENTLIVLNYNKYQPGALGNEEFYKTVYKDHPYAHPILGTLETVSKISKKDIQDFYSEFYIAENAVITIVGGMHRDTARNISNKISSKLLRGTKAKNLPDVKMLNKFVAKKVDHQANQSYIFLGQPCINRTDKDYLAFAVGNHILGDGFISRLFKEVRIKEGYAYHVGSEFYPGEKEGPFIAQLQTRNMLVKKALRLVKKIITRYIKEGPTKDELRKAKKHLTGAFPLSLERNADILNIVSALSFYDMPLDYYDNYVENIENITVEDIRNVFQNKLNVDKMVQVVVGETEK